MQLCVLVSNLLGRPIEGREWIRHDRGTRVPELQIGQVKEPDHE